MSAQKPPSVLRGLARGLHHVAIAVPDLAVARELYEQTLGLASSAVETVEGQKVDVLMLRAGAQRIELLQPVSEDSPIAGFLAKRGAGIHHLAWLVDDVELALEQLGAAGVRLIDSTPRPGSHGTRIAFLHPKATGGVLMELVEDPAENSAS